MVKMRSLERRLKIRVLILLDPVPAKVNEVSLPRFIIRVVLHLDP